MRRAGFTPCLNSNALQFHDERTNKSSTRAVSILGSKQDALHIKRMADNFAQIVHFKNQSTLIVRGDVAFQPGQIVLIADCIHAQVLRVLACKKIQRGTQVILTQSLKHSYQVPSYIGEWLEETFFIKLNSLNKPALFYHLHHTEELTNLVNSVMFSLKNTQLKTLVSINLGLVKGQNYTLEVAARTT